MPLPYSAHSSIGPGILLDYCHAHQWRLFSRIDCLSGRQNTFRVGDTKWIPTDPCTIRVPERPAPSWMPAKGPVAIVSCCRLGCNKPLRSYRKNNVPQRRSEVSYTFSKSTQSTIRDSAMGSDRTPSCRHPSQGIAASDSEWVQLTSNQIIFRRWLPNLIRCRNGRPNEAVFFSRAWFVPSCSVASDGGRRIGVQGLEGQCEHLLHSADRCSC